MLLYPNVFVNLAYIIWYKILKMHCPVCLWSRLVSICESNLMFLLITIELSIYVSTKPWFSLSQGTVTEYCLLQVLVLLNPISLLSPEVIIYDSSCLHKTKKAFMFFHLTCWLLRSMILNVFSYPENIISNGYWKCQWCVWCSTRTAHFEWWWLPHLWGEMLKSFCKNFERLWR